MCIMTHHNIATQETQQEGDVIFDEEELLLIYKPIWLKRGGCSPTTEQQSPKEDTCEFDFTETGFSHVD